MITTTTFAEFSALSKKQPVVPVCRVLFADSDTPVNIYRKVASGAAGTFLLESAAQGIFDRYSFVGARTFGQLTEVAGKAHWIPDPDLGITAEQLLPGGISDMAPVAALNAIYKHWQSPAHPELPPLVNGFVGYLGWESVAEFEDIKIAASQKQSVPRQYMGFVADLVVIDHREGQLTLIANVLCEKGVDHNSQTQWHAAQQRLDSLQQALGAPAASPLTTFARDNASAVNRSTTSAEFFAAVAKTKEHIVDGDAFQVVLSQQFQTECAADPLDVYRVLRHLNPSPYLYLLAGKDIDGADFAVVGSSPEALITVDSTGAVLTHPIAGSRPRGQNPSEDAKLAAELLADEKERSEHLMLVDLSRNDLSRVCEPGSVAVTEFMQIERFSHVTHISSTVKGQLRQEVNAVDALVATFPAGTLSGAPKPWALRIINDLEPVRRGVYGGVVGYFGLGGAADLAIAIRTATIKDGVATVQAGAGLVADSVPESEEQECLNKAAAPLRAVAIANSMTEAKLAHE